MSFRNKKFILFDLDGCLLNTSRGIETSIEYTLREIGETLPGGVSLSQFIGPPIQHSFKHLLNLNDNAALDAAKIFRDYYREDALFLAEVYPGIINLLQELNRRGFLLGIATYKREDYALKLIRHFGLDVSFQTMRGADMNGVMTKTDIICECVRELGCQIPNGVMIGDTMHDLGAARALDMDFIGVTWGYGFKSDDIKNDWIQVNYPSDILEYIAL